MSCALLLEAPTLLLPGPRALSVCAWGRQARLPVGDGGGWTGMNRPPPCLPLHLCAQCQFLPSPPPAGPQRQRCQPWGCQEACCHANGPGWVGAMVMSDSKLFLGLWARGPGRAGGVRKPAQRGTCCPLTPHSPHSLPPGLGQSRRQHPLGRGGGVGLRTDPALAPLRMPLPAPFRFSG